MRNVKFTNPPIKSIAVKMEKPRLRPAIELVIMRRDETIRPRTKENALIFNILNLRYIEFARTRNQI